MKRRSQRDRVKRRAKERCEYCQFPERDSGASHCLDHIIARQHGGHSTLSNLAFACIRCNAFKGTNLVSVDPHTHRRTPLFHPRRDIWKEHFELGRDGSMVGLTPIGRATVRLLQVNSPARKVARLILRDLHEWEP